jgi:hypothetical protein
MSDPNGEKIEVDPKVIEELAAEKEAVRKMSEELKELRAKKNEELQAKDAEIAALKGTKKEDIEDVPSQVEKVLKEKEKKEIEEAQKEAINEFRNSIPDFSVDNDPGDIKFKAFEKEMSKFNFEGIRSKEQFKNRLKEVHEFMNRGKRQEASTEYPYASTKKGSSSTPSNDNQTLSDKEKTLIRRHGFTEERYLKLRDKQTGYINTLLKFVD